MEMTNSEIIRSYNNAKNKQRQIGILADLNGCKRIEIEEIVSGKSTSEKQDGEPKELQKPAEESQLINWLYDQLDATEGHIRALEARYKELSVALKVAEEYREVVEHDLRNTESK